MHASNALGHQSAPDGSMRPPTATPAMPTTEDQGGPPAPEAALDRSPNVYGGGRSGAGLLLERGIIRRDLAPVFQVQLGDLAPRRAHDTPTVSAFFPVGHVLGRRDRAAVEKGTQGLRISSQMARPTFFVGFMPSLLPALLPAA